MRISRDESRPAEEDGKLSHESWVEWVKRTTHIVEEQLAKTGLDDWVTAVRRKLWRWAGHLATEARPAARSGCYQVQAGCFSKWGVEGW